MGTLAYNRLQIRYIHKYARRLHIGDEYAAVLWTRNGLAVHFAELYRYIEREDSFCTKCAG